MRSNIIEEITRRDRGDENFYAYSSNSNPSFEELVEACQKTLDSIPKSFGSCIMMSVGLVAVLKYDYSIEALAVLGDLKINEFDIFKCRDNIGMPSQKDELIQKQWDGHCWVEIGNILCDLSIFRTAQTEKHPSLLKSYIESNFGYGKDGLISPIERIPDEMTFHPKFVLNDIQIAGVIRGLSAQQKGLI